MDEFSIRQDDVDIDRSGVRTFKFDASLVETSLQETSFKQPKDLPAWQVRGQFLTKLDACKFLIVQAPTGSGKSTIFPALVAKLLPKDRIWCTQVIRNTTEAVIRLISKPQSPMISTLCVYASACVSVCLCVHMCPAPIPQALRCPHRKSELEIAQRQRNRNQSRL